MLEFNSDDILAEYDDPESYDNENRWAADDDFYLELAAQAGGPVLDIACGTGRLTRAIAAPGLDVTGLDIVPAMLARARLLDAEATVDWVLGDCRTMELGRKFQLEIMTSHAFQHLLTRQDQEAFFHRASAHLLDGGTLAFETRNLEALSSENPAEFQFWKTIQDDELGQIDFFTQSQFDQRTMTDRVKMKREIKATGAVDIDVTAPLKYTSTAELNEILQSCGFTIIYQYGDWSGNPLAADLPEVISVCQKAG